MSWQPLLHQALQTCVTQMEAAQFTAVVKLHVTLMVEEAFSQPALVIERGWS